MLQKSLCYYVFMAKRIDSLPNKARARYPWKEWTDGSIWQLVRGDDYTVEDDAMRSMAHLYARRNNMRAETRRWEKGMIIQFHKLSPAPSKKLLKKARV
jgi:hypothetical protein